MKKFICVIGLVLALTGASTGALAACAIQVISPGETRIGSLATDDCIDNNADGHDYYYDWYEFQGTAGQQIAISNSSTAIDPDLLLIFPDDNYRYDNDSGGGTTARIPASGYLTLSQTGTYAIVASSALPLQTGAYTLTLTLSTSGTDYCATLQLGRDGDQVAAGGLSSPLTFGVTADSRCAWSAQSNSTWITITSGASGSGNGQVGYLVAANTASTPRTGTITVASRTFTVSQPGASGTVTTTSNAIVAAGSSIVYGSHSLLLRDDGTLWAWGQNGSGQLGDGTTLNRSVPVPVLSGVKAVAAGGEHSLAVKTDGTVWAWGDNLWYQLGDGTFNDHATPVQVMSGARAVAAGDEHSLAVKTDGTLWAWGSNYHGQLGDGTTSNRAVPTLVMSGVQAVAAGNNTSLALRTDGTLWAWGGNDAGQVGDGTNVDRKTPVLVLNGVRAMAIGYAHVLAIKTDGTLWAWGRNLFNQLGDGTDSDRASPVRVQGLSSVRAVAAGSGHSLAIQTDGTLWAWGLNTSGQLGRGTRQGSATPVEVTAMRGAQGIAAGGDYSLGVKSDGTVWSWGENASGELGDGTTIYQAVPLEVPVQGQDVAAAERHSLLVKSDGTVWGWGYNYFGQLGDGTSIDRAAPVMVQGLSGARAVVAGWAHSAAIKTDGTLWAWGFNGDGELGDGTTTSRPKPVSALSGVKAAAAGFGFTLAARTDGTVWTWGRNDEGQLGDGTTTATRPAPAQLPSLSGVQAVAAGRAHALALKSDGTVWAWGGNPFGELGQGNYFGSRRTPVQVQGLSDVQAIAAGTHHSLALKTDGTLWTWGDNFDGQLGDGTYDFSRATPVQVLSGVRAMAAGDTFSVAIKTDGTVWGWGSSTVPGGPQRAPKQNPFLRNLARFAAGDLHVVAIAADGQALAWGDNSFQQLGIARVTETLTPTAVRDPLAAYAGSDVVTEYFNPTIKNGAGTSGIGHYFITAATAEAASIDTGGSGPGWARTGRTFRAWNDPARAPAGAVPVCRFYARVPNSHFYTASAAECQGLKNQNPTNDANLGWSYEGIAFYTVVPTNGSCGPGYHPVYRSYNNRFDVNPALNDGNHRITPSYNDYARSIRFFGYADEGVALCSPASTNPGGDLQATYSYPGTSVQSGASLTAEFLFGNNGAGRGDGGNIYIALPAEVANWSVTCVARYGATCPATSDLNRLRQGQAISTWPAGGTLNFTATGTAPQVSSGGASTLSFAAAVANASGSPDGTSSNDLPPLAQTAIKAAAVCNTVLNPTALQLGPVAQTAHVSLIIGAGCAWSAQSSASWVTATPAGASGDATLTLTLAANPAATERSATITVSGQTTRTIVVSQSGVVCTFSANPPTLTIAAAGQTVPVTLSAPVGCSWTAKSSAAWLSATPASGSGGGSLTIGVQANTETAARGGAVTVGNLSIPVAQAGLVEVAAPVTAPADPCASLRLQREGDQVAAGGLTGALSFDVVADRQCTWRAQSNTRWITLTAGAGGSGNGTVRYLVDEYFDYPPRNGSLTVGGKTFTVNQLGVSAGSQGGDSGGDGGGGGGGGSSGGGSSGGGAG